jgi:peptide/nickel transport system ATP-binding protein
VSRRAQVLGLRLELRQRLNLSFIFISHDIAVLRCFCDCVAVVHHGELVEEGLALQVPEHPQHAYTQRLLAAALRPEPGLRTSALAAVEAP